jgi:hypothetical protein
MGTRRLPGLEVQYPANAVAKRDARCSAVGERFQVDTCMSGLWKLGLRS